MIDAPNNKWTRISKTAYSGFLVAKFPGIIRREVTIAPHVPLITTPTHYHKVNTFAHVYLKWPSLASQTQPTPASGLRD